MPPRALPLCSAARRLGGKETHVKKYLQDLILSVVCIGISAALLLSIPGQVRIISTGARASIDAQTFPIFVGILLLVSSFGLLAKSVYSWLQARRHEQAAQAPNDGTAADRKNARKPAIVFVLMVFYILVMQPIGFILSSLVFGIIFLYINQIRKWWQYVIFAVLVFGVFALFKYGLYVPLPTLGIL